jgi:hypothetical protein
MAGRSPRRVIPDRQVDVSLELGRRHVAELLVQPVVVVEGEPLKRLVLSRLEAGKAPAGDQLGLEGADERFGHRVVVGAARAHRRLDPQLVEAVGVAQAGLLGSPVGWATSRPSRSRRATAISRVSITGSVRMWVAICQPTIRRLKTSRMKARYTKPAKVRREVRCDPQPVRGRRESALHQVASPLGRRLSRGGGAMPLAAPHPRKALDGHQPADPVTADLHPAPGKLSPGLADAVDAAVALSGGVDLADQPGVSEGLCRRRPRPVRVEAGGGDAEGTADRLDLEAGAVGLDVGAHRLERGSSSPAKKIDAVRRLSLARRSSAFSRSRARMRSRSSVVVPARSPATTSAWRTQVRSDSAPTPSWRAIRVMTPKLWPSAIVSATILTARSFSSGGYRFWDACIAPGAPSFPSDEASTSSQGGSPAWIHGDRSWPTRGLLRSDLFDFIGGFYSPTRIQRRLGYRSPADYGRIGTAA